MTSVRPVDTLDPAGKTTVSGSFLTVRPASRLSTFSNVSDDDNMEKQQEEEDDQKDFLLKRQAKGYAGASSIHGLGYIAEDGRPRTEK